MHLAALLLFLIPSVALAAKHDAPHRRHHVKARLNSTALDKRQTSGGRATFFDVGLGACGVFNVASDYIVALNTPQYGSGSPGPECFKMITIQYNGNTAQAQIMDECPSCNYGDLDMSRGLFDHFASEDLGEFQMTWWYDDGTSAPTTSAPPPPPPPTSTYVPPPPPTTTWSPPPPPPTTTSTPPPPPPTTTWSPPPTTSTTPPPPPTTTSDPPSSSTTPSSSSSSSSTTPTSTSTSHSSTSSHSTISIGGASTQPTTLIATATFTVTGTDAATATGASDTSDASGTAIPPTATGTGAGVTDQPKINNTVDLNQLVVAMGNIIAYSPTSN